MVCTLLLLRKLNKDLLAIIPGVHAHYKAKKHDMVQGVYLSARETS